MRWAIICVMLLVSPVAAQNLGGFARVDPAQSQAKDGFFGKTHVTLSLSQGVPYRLFHLTDPNRFVIDFQQVDFAGLLPEDFDQSDQIKALRYGALGNGWSRMVFDLAAPMLARDVSLDIANDGGAAKLSFTLAPVEADDFAKSAGHPEQAQRQSLPDPSLSYAPNTQDDDILVVLDAGHGGLDPGAVAGPLKESTLMLALVRDVREALLRQEGINVALTRNSDVFISLEERVSMAYELGADVFISLHADAVTLGVARGVTVYSLSDQASDEASELLAARHDRDELLSGVDLSEADDEIANVLLEIARNENAPRIKRLAEELIDGFQSNSVKVNSRPHRHAAFSVLKAADIPSVLIEAGFMSTSNDLKNLQNTEWRQKFAQGVAQGILTWSQKEDILAPKLRQ